MILYIINYKFGGGCAHSLWQGELESKVTIMQHFPPNNSHTEGLMKMGCQNSAFLSCVSALAFMVYSELTNIKH